MVHFINLFTLFYIYITAPFHTCNIILSSNKNRRPHTPQSSLTQNCFSRSLCSPELTLSVEQAVSSPTQTQMQLLLRRRSFRLTRALFCAAAVLEWFTAAAQLQHRVPNLHWLPATATWYGSPEGDGSDGATVSFSYIFLFALFSLFWVSFRVCKFMGRVCFFEILSRRCRKKCD